jgi:ribosomal protein L40E
VVRHLNGDPPDANKCRRCTRSQTFGESIDDPALAGSRARNPSSRKSELVIACLSASDGTTISDICKANGWQAHSCRAFFTSLRKSGRPVERSKRPDGTTVYKLPEGEGAAQ